MRALPQLQRILNRARFKGAHAAAVLSSIELSGPLLRAHMMIHLGDSHASIHFLV